jgi:hypothetical protein
VLAGAGNGWQGRPGPWEAVSPEPTHTTYPEVDRDGGEEAPGDAEPRGPGADLPPQLFVLLQKVPGQLLPIASGDGPEE